MGGNLCGADQQVRQVNIFQYIYAEDSKEARIKHNDHIRTQVESLKPNLEDCENRLRHSERRFKDLGLSTQPIKLKCEGKQVSCYFERPEAFLRKNSRLANKMYPILNRNNCRPSNVIIGDDVMQYFGLFLCYLADNPELITRIILTDQNSYGIAAVYVVWEGKREILYIDDYILCNQNGPVFSQPINGQDMWPCLIEKAWFKLKLSFSNTIDRVHPIEVFKKFLLLPIKTYLLGPSIQQNRKIIKEQLIDQKSQNIKTGCVVTSKATPHHKIGLSGRKSFYLLKVFRFQNKNYFYLRNPCGLFDFRGTLNDVPTTLEQHLSSKLNIPIIPGNFLLSEEQFQQQIESFFIASSCPDSPVISDKQLNFYANQTPEVYVKFRIFKQAPISLRLRQMGKLGYAPLTYLVFDADHCTLVSGENNDEGCFGVQDTILLNRQYQMLNPGTYFMRLKKKTQNKKDNQYQWLVQSTFKSRDLLLATSQEIIKFEESSSLQVKEEFYSMLKKYAQRKMAGKKSSSIEEIEHIVIWLGDIVIIYIRKTNNSKQSMNLELHFPDLLNLECTSHEKIIKGYSSLPPFKQDALIVFQKIKLTERTSLGSYSLSPY